VAVLLSAETVGNGIMTVKSLERRNPTTRERNLVAAIQRFSKFGYRRTSINDVAEEAGLARATVYLYWRRKEDLFVAGLERFNVHSRNLAETAAARKGVCRGTNARNGHGAVRRNLRHRPRHRERP